MKPQAARPRRRLSPDEYEKKWSVVKITMAWSLAHLAPFLSLFIFDGLVSNIVFVGLIYFKRHCRRYLINA